MVRETVGAVSGVDPSGNETLREYLDRVGEEWALEPDEVESLTDALERVAFGPDDSSPARVRDILGRHGIGDHAGDASSEGAVVGDEIVEAEPDAAGESRTGAESSAGTGSRGGTVDRIDGPQDTDASDGYVDESASEPSTPEPSAQSGSTTSDAERADTESATADPAASNDGTEGNELDEVFGSERSAADVEASPEELLEEIESEEHAATGPTAASEQSTPDDAAAERTVRLDAARSTGSLSELGSGGGSGDDVSGTTGTSGAAGGADAAGEVGALGSVGKALPGTAGDAFDAFAARFRDSASPWLLRYLPALALLPLLGTSVPTHFQATREVGTHFQALAFARDGLEAYSYLTIREIPWSLHLHSWLASPFVALGYVEGGRLVSAVAALAVTVLAAFLAKRLFGRVAALLAPVLLWANPYFFRFAWAAMPEMLALCLSTAAVAAMVRFDAVDDERWLAASLGCLVLATWTHVWAVTVAVPLAAYLLARHRQWEAGWVGVAAVGALAIVSLAASLQPAVPDQGFAVTSTGLDAELVGAWVAYWLRRFVSAPAFVAQGLLFVGAFATAGYWLRRAWTEIREGSLDHEAEGLLEPEPPEPSPTLARAALLGSWALAGLALPLALPAGSVDGNSFYLWGAVVPVTLTAAWIGSRTHDRLADRDSYRANALGGDETTAAQTALRAAVALLVAGALLNGLVVDAGTVAETPEERLDGRTRVAPFDTAPDEARLAGLAIRERGVTEPDDVVFVGDWVRAQAAYTGGVARVLVYSGVLPRGTWALGDSPAVRYAESTDAASDCEVTVVREGDGSVTVEPC